MLKPASPSKLLRLLPALACILAWGILSGGLRAQEPFPEGTPGEVYYCPRIDLNPAKDGGPLTITLDGELNEPAWQRAAFHGYYEHWKGGTLPTDELDCDPKWAAVADENFLYVAWRIVDDSRQSQSTGCASFNDDAIELYFDGNGEGITCGSCGYGIDDMQLIVGVENLGLDDPLLFAPGMVRSGGCQGAPGPEVFQGVVTDLVSDEDLPGWQGEIAIALDNVISGEWHIVPTHGTMIGWDVHVDDDDAGGGQDGSTSALIWSKRDGGSQAWQNTGVWGKLQFITPDKPLAEVTRDLPDGLQNGGSGQVSIKAKPVFGVGTIRIIEELPASLTPSNPSSGGTIAGNTVTWDLGPVNAEVAVTYTLTAASDAVDIALPGRATIDGEPMAIGGDGVYTGSPISTLGFIKLWNHLGPLAGPVGVTLCDPGLDLPLDWIRDADGSTTEADVAPFPGLVARIAYGGDGVNGARATGLKQAGGLVTRDRFPVWKAGLSPTDTIDHASAAVNGFDAEEHLTLSSVYVTTKRAIDTAIGIGSDDSIQVYVNDVSVGEDHACRGWGAANQEQNSFLVTLPAGESRILVKVSDGGGASGFRLRFQNPDDPTGPGLLPPELTVSLTSAVNPPPAAVVRDLSKDTFALGEAIDVALQVTAAPAASIVVREALPELAAVTEISDGGVVNGNTVQWTLNGVTTKTLTYKLTPASCTGQADFGSSTWSVGPITALVTGEASLRGPAVNEVALNEWQSGDIGYTGGAAQPLGDRSVLVQGLGTGVKLTRDEFRFVHVPVSGDFEITARIDCMDDPGGAGQGGLMVRDTLDTFSAHAFFSLGSNPSAAHTGLLKGNFRRETKAERSSSPITISQKDVTTLPVYLKLKRAGINLSFERSVDGVAYTEVAVRQIGTTSTQVNLRNETLVGLAVSGGGDGASRYTFSNVSGPPFIKVDVGPQFRRGDSDGNGSIELTDAVKLLNYLFLGQQKPECLDASDVDDNGEADISDAISNLNYQFLGAAAPAAPGPTTCGKDPNAEAPDLGCEKSCT